MILVSEKILDYFRAPGRCQECGRACPDGRDPDHCIIPKGLGGGSRIDASANIMALCRDCHSLGHASSIKRQQLRDCLAARVGLPLETIREAFQVILRLDKDASPEAVEAELAGLDQVVAQLVRKSIEECRS